MEGDYDGDADYGHVEGEAEVGEECSFVGAVVACVAVGVVEEEGAEEGWDAEDLGAVWMAGCFVSIVLGCLLKMERKQSGI